MAARQLRQREAESSAQPISPRGIAPVIAAIRSARPLRARPRRDVGAAGGAGAGLDDLVQRPVERHQRAEPEQEAERADDRGAGPALARCARRSRHAGLAAAQPGERIVLVVACARTSVRTLAGRHGPGQAGPGERPRASCLVPAGPVGSLERQRPRGGLQGWGCSARSRARSRRQRSMGRPAHGRHRHAADVGGDMATQAAQAQLYQKLAASGVEAPGHDRRDPRGRRARLQRRDAARVRRDDHAGRRVALPDDDPAGDAAGADGGHLAGHGVHRQVRPRQPVEREPLRAGRGRRWDCSRT